MRKKKNKEINIFSTSVIDIFASALGVFILFCMVLIPNLGKKTELVNKKMINNTPPIKKIKVESKDIEAISERIKLKDINEAQQKMISNLQKKITEMNAENKKLKDEMKSEDEVMMDELRLNKKVILNHLHFYSNTATLIMPFAKWEIDRVAKFLKKYKETKIEVSGHVHLSNSYRKTINRLRSRNPSSFKSEEIALLSLSTERAKTVCKELWERGIDKNRFKCIGKGSSEMKVFTDSLEKSYINRRVEIRTIN